MTHYSPSGSLWNRWDLHFHTPSSYDYQDKGLTSERIVESLIGSGVRVVAITDHHRLDVALIEAMKATAGDRLTILPGIELRSELGGSESVHYIGIFSEESDVADLWTKLAGKLNITEAEVARRGDENVYCPFVETAQVIRSLGGVVSVHAGRKTNTIENLKNSDYIKQVVKKDLVRDCIDIYEVGAVADCEGYVKSVFPHLGRPLPLVLCSDNHNAAAYTVKAPLWLRADPTFRGLKMVLREPLGRVFIGEKPDELIRVEQNATKYVKSIEYERAAGAPPSERWFSGKIVFNPGLVAIVGNKGSGKSALADTLGLLGASRNGDAFSFLSDKRFRRPSSGLAQHFSATLRWESGEDSTRCLKDSPQATEIERLKYLPQDHVEKVCNELAGSGETGFEKELKSVIFSHVPDSLRLGQTNLDDLVRFRSGEKQKRIDALVRQLKEASRSRAALESQANPDTKREIEEKIKQREIEIEAHDKAKPIEKPNPAAETGSAPPDPTLLTALAEAEAEKKAIESQIEATRELLRREERRLAVSQRLLERIGNFSKEFDVFRAGLEEDATELGLKANDLVGITLNRQGPEQVRDVAAAAVRAAKKALSTTEPEGLAAKLNVSAAKLAAVQANLDAPNRAYQSYLRELTEWQDKRAELEGSETEPDSLKGLRAAVATFADLPAKIANAKEAQAALALEIHQEKAAQAEVYRSLYQPVQEFIDTHALAKDKLKLEFRAELTNEDFSDRLLGLLALNRRGSFMGVDDGRARAEKLVDATRWDDAGSVKSFLAAVDDALHADLRDPSSPAVQLRDQLLKGKRPEEVFDLLYGLEYIEPRYILRWEGKDLEMLSPGERGTLLLVFYLLIDKGDMPLVIDQPEGNLDNHTVAKVLVDCIREARRRRQVFIVTHNPNLAVVCDADQVVHASIDKANGNAITYTSGSLENPGMSKFVTDVLEGTRWAFGVRGDKYAVGE